MFTLTLYLGPNGGSVEIKNSVRNAPSIQLQKDALACKTHVEVLNFLRRIDSFEVEIPLRFYHYHDKNTVCKGRIWKFGESHSCPLKQQIEFVENKILEQAQVNTTSKSSCVIL